MFVFCGNQQVWIELSQGGTLTRIKEGLKYYCFFSLHGIYSQLQKYISTSLCVYKSLRISQWITLCFSF